MFYILYNLLLHFYAIWGFFYAIYKKKSLSALFARLRPPTLQKKEGTSLVWIHAVSFGEMKAAAALVTYFQQHKEATLILSTCSSTGFHEAQKLSPNAFYLPFDLSYLITPFVKKIKPDLLILMESDFWPNLLCSVKAAGGKIAVVNGKISERSFRRLLPFKAIASQIYGAVDRFLLQTESYKERFLALGIDPTKLEVTGNVKVDNPMPRFTEEEKEVERKKYAINPSDFVLTLGSTHDPEESLWLDALLALWTHFPHIKVFLVPRHPERTAFISSLLEKKKVAFSKSSEGGDFAKGRVILVDRMGLLLQCYQLSQLAYVGGTFAPKVGGHNLIEPAYYGVCALYGPYLHSQPGFAAMLREFEAGIELKEGGIADVVAKLIEKPGALREYGERGCALIAASRGTLEKNKKKLEDLLSIKRDCDKILLLSRDGAVVSSLGS